ncbi:MAG: M48 family metalloprotease [Pirellulaceae bacterium]
MILLTLVCREIAGNQPHLPWRTSLLATIGISLGLGLLVKTHMISALHNPLAVEAAFVRSRRWAEIAWCCFLPAALLATGWISQLNLLHVQGLPQTVVLLGAFLPTVLFMFLLEITAAQVDEIRDLANSNHGGTETHNWVGHLRLRLRLGDLASLLTCLTPVLLIGLASDTATFLPTHWMPEFATDSWFKFSFLLVGIVAFGVGFPAAISRWAGAEPITDRDLSVRIQLYFAQLGVRGVQPLIVRSNQRWAGAAVVGWFPKCRKLWLGDALLSTLDSRELDMVIMHEIAHVERKHFLWRSLPIFSTALIACGVWCGLRAFITHELVLTGLQFALLSTTGFGLLLGLSVLAKFCELDADRRACELARRACPWAQSHSPNDVLADALQKLLQGPDSAAMTWLHPSLAQRLDNLKPSYWSPDMLDSEMVSNTNQFNL